MENERNELVLCKPRRPAGSALTTGFHGQNRDPGRLVPKHSCGNRNSKAGSARRSFRVSLTAAAPHTGIPPRAVHIGGRSLAKAVVGLIAVGGVLDLLSFLITAASEDGGKGMELLDLMGLPQLLLYWTTAGLFAAWAYQSYRNLAAFGTEGPSLYARLGGRRVLRSFPESGTALSDLPRNLASERWQRQPGQLEESSRESAPQMLVDRLSRDGVLRADCAARPVLAGGTATFFWRCTSPLTW